MDRSGLLESDESRCGQRRFDVSLPAGFFAMDALCLYETVSVKASRSSVMNSLKAWVRTTRFTVPGDGYGSKPGNTEDA